MDISGLLTAPTVIVMAFVMIFSALLGFVIGWSREAARKAQALSQVAEMHDSAMARLGAEHRNQISLLSKSGADEIENLERLHGEELEQLRLANQGELDALKTAHASEIGQINEANDAKISELKKYQEKEIARIIEDTTAARGVLEDTIEILNERIAEGRANNIFSVSRSGEKLIQVVRSVQMLAREIDETSRAVSGGEYSFFEQIKDQRDRETVLRLTGENSACPDEPGDEGDLPFPVPPVAEEEPGLQDINRG